MNREVLQTALLVVFGLALILVGAVVFMQSQTLANLSDRLDGMSQSMMESSQKMDDTVMKMDAAVMEMEEIEEGRTMEDQAVMDRGAVNSSSVVSWDLSFDYPKSWYVATYDVIEQFPLGPEQSTFLRLTSSPGVLEHLSAIYADEIGGPPQTFEEGFLANMRKSRYQDPPTTEQTKYENIWRIVDEDCDALTCPDERYMYSGAETAYVIDFHYTDSSYARYVDTVLSNLKSVR
jgi:hypothetical protein